MAAVSATIASVDASGNSVASLQTSSDVGVLQSALKVRCIFAGAPVAYLIILVVGKRRARGDAKDVAAKTRTHFCIITVRS